MITSNKVLVEQTITTYKCDFCVNSTNKNYFYGGWEYITQCIGCGKHICPDHRNVYQIHRDKSYDYPDAVVCPDCNETFSESWNYALNSIKLSDSVKPMALSKFKELNGLEDYNLWKMFAEMLDQGEAFYSSDGKELCFYVTSSEKFCGDRFNVEYVSKENIKEIYSIWKGKGDLENGRSRLIAYFKSKDD